MIIHYNCTIGSFLLHSFLLIYHPYPPSFHEMIFTLVYINTLFRCVLTCREVGKGLCNHRLSKSKHGGQHLKQYYKDRGFRATYLESVSTVQFSCYLHHMESLKTKSRPRRSRAELAMRNGQCICNMCALFVFSTHT